jgi:tagatose-1,6-bisphosphate aldolase non-catalytic subunit AgaZ/GatZ
MGDFILMFSDNTMFVRYGEEGIVSTSEIHELYQTINDAQKMDYQTARQFQALLEDGFGIKASIVNWHDLN